MRLGNYVMRLDVFRDRDLTSNKGLVVQFQVGTYSPSNRVFLVWKDGKFTRHNGRQSVKMDMRYARSRDVKIASKPRGA